jgi:hypothetical protein
MALSNRTRQFRVRWLAVALTVTAVGLAACGDDRDANGAATTSGADTDLADPAEGSEEIVIKTDLNIPTGEVLGGSSIGDSPFCPGGTFRDKDGNDEIGFLDRTYRCPDGSLRMGFSPHEPQGLTQTGPWEIVSGTGAYEGMEGSGQMEVTFKSANSDQGRETFTGTVAR